MEFAPEFEFAIDELLAIVNYTSTNNTAGLHSWYWYTGHAKGL